MPSDGNLGGGGFGELIILGGFVVFTGDRAVAGVRSPTRSDPDQPPPVISATNGSISKKFTRPSPLQSLRHR